MSVAFTKEQDFESVAANLPDRPISSHRNLVTPEGLAELDRALAEARAAYAAAQASSDIAG
ncbi:transcription elongation factor, partial [Hansschlegelia beijingensis]